MLSHPSTSFADKCDQFYINILPTYSNLKVAGEQIEVTKIIKQLKYNNNLP